MSAPSAEFRRGVAACVRVLAASAQTLEDRPLLADVETLCAHPGKRATLVDLLRFLAEQMAALADPDPK